MVALLIGLILAGCGEDSGNEAAGPNGLGEPGPAPSQADVMACDDAASAYAGLCTNDGNRTCQMAAYQSYCATAANPRAAAEALDCLRTNSSSNSCRTFADPSGAAECVEMALAGATADTFSELSTRLSADCDEFRFFSTPFRFEPPFVLLSFEQQQEVLDCASESADCSATASCLATGVQAPFDACFSE